ncbi:MAG: hypothetical protein EU542_05705 [Promethearchaeota archaeon]|nr:MAG: hypothetical protein EU542_05705 [Candidatus Lokiarchaeota archaeon]
MLSRKKKVLIVFPLILAGIGILTFGLIIGVPPTFNPPSLEFPITEVENIYDMRGYGIENWSGPGTYHNGIDLVINTSVSLVSPVQGTVTVIEERRNEHSIIQNILFDVVIQINWGWKVKLVLEPNFPGDDTYNNTLQREAISVEVLQRVSIGTPIASLLYSGYYSHLHYMLEGPSGDACAYFYSSEQAQNTFYEIAMKTNQSICVG